MSYARFGICLFIFHFFTFYFRLFDMEEYQIRISGLVSATSSLSDGFRSNLCFFSNVFALFVVFVLLIRTLCHLLCVCLYCQVPSIMFLTVCHSLFTIESTTKSVSLGIVHALTLFCFRTVCHSLFLFLLILSFALLRFDHFVIHL